MIERVVRYINQYNMIEEGDLVIAGVSGGADSVCMLMQLNEYKKYVSYTLKVVHMNHLIREDASADASYVEELCSKMNIPFVLYEEDVTGFAKEQGLSTEEAGRIIRYRAFESEIAKENRTGKIAVAHNRNDVAETVLFNVFRGTGIEGLCSLGPVNGNIIRPLLCLTREEIEDYLADEAIEFRTDSTNLGNEYARNKIRNVLLPYADDNICSNAIEHIANLSDKMRDIKEFIRTYAAHAFEECARYDAGRVLIEVSEFAVLDELMKQEVILRAFDKLTKGRKDITEAHVKAVLSLIDKDGEKRVDLPYDLEAVKQYEYMIIRKKQVTEPRKFSVEIEPDSTIVLPNKATAHINIFGRDYTKEVIQKPYTKWFDYDKIISCPVIRHRKSGDYLTINSDMSKKSLKDYLINEKIPREQRDELLVVADGEHVLWVIGYRISEYYKVTEDTKCILEVSID